MLSLLRVGALVALGACLSLSALRAEIPIGFSAQISPENRQAIGATRLSTAQLAALDAFVQRDIDAARAGSVVGFAKTFSERRTPEERQEAGIDQLSAAERDRLDVLVASAIANRPGVSYSYIPAPAAGPNGHVLSERTSAIIHGEVTLFVGAGSGGRSWYGGSFETEITDPTRHLTIMVGASEIKGRGVRPCYYDGRIW